MKILLATNYQPPHMGGIEYAAGSLKRCWEKAGHEVTWITTDVPRGKAANAPDNIRVPAINLLEKWWEINSPFPLPFSGRQINQAIDRHDVVNTHSLAPGLARSVLFRALQRGKPTVVTQHVGVIPLQLKALSSFQKWYLCRGARRAVRSGAGLTFVGLAVKNWFMQEADLGEEQVMMMPAGIDHDQFYFVTDAERSICRERWKLRDDRLSVLFVGRFYEKKGLPLLREVAARCNNMDFTLLGKGPIDPLAWKLRNVRVINYVETEELRALYGAHDLLIMPSIGEGWPAVIPQAMACGLSCLISPETFEGYQQDTERFIIAPRNADRLVETLESAARAKIPLMGQRSDQSDYAMRAWNWQDTADLYLEKFEHLKIS